MTKVNAHPLMNATAYLLLGENIPLGLYETPQKAADAALASYQKGKAGWPQFKKFEILPLKINGAPTPSHPQITLHPNPTQSALEETFP